MVWVAAWLPLEVAVTVTLLVPAGVPGLTMFPPLLAPELPPPQALIHNVEQLKNASRTSMRALRDLPVPEGNMGKTSNPGSSNAYRKVAFLKGFRAAEM